MRIFYALVLTATTLVCASCNNIGKGSKETSANTKTADSLTPVEKLYNHFKENNNLPLVVDSVFIFNISKRDSLGANEMKLIATQCLKDSLIDGMDYTMKDFYKIDSVKAKHAFEKWADSLDIGMTKYSNAYALQRIKLDDKTVLLIWALHSSSYEADPFFIFTDIYFTVVYEGKVAHTFIMGEYQEGGDPPSMAQTKINGKLEKDGKLTMEWKNVVEDIDSLTGEVSHVHYEYSIANGQISKKAEKVDDVKEIKLKSSDL